QIGKPTILAFIACGIPFVVIASVPALDTALLFVAAWGVGMAVADVATFSLLHRLLDTPLLPRVTGAIESAKLALEGLGALVGPVLASTLGIRWALALAGLPLPAVVLVGRKLLHRLDNTASERTHILALLHGVPFLETLDMAALESLAGRGGQMSVPAGARVGLGSVLHVSPLCRRLVNRRLASPSPAPLVPALFVRQPPLPPPPEPPAP